MREEWVNGVWLETWELGNISEAGLHGWLDGWQAGVFGTAKWTTHVSKDSLLLYPQTYTIQDGDETIVKAAESCTVLV